MKPVLPGLFPYKRGINAAGYRDAPFVLQPFGGSGDIERGNQELRDLVANGAGGLWLRIDVPAWSRTPAAAIQTAGDLAELLRGIHLDAVPVYFSAVESAAPVAALWTAATRELGYDFRSLEGGVANDIFCESVFSDRTSADAETALDLIEWALVEAPAWLPVIPGAVPRESEIGASFELGAVACSMQEHVEKLRQRGIDIEALARRWMIVLSSGNRLLDEIAKFRAGRVLFATVMRERAGMTDEAALQARICAWTSESALAARQPDVNLIRVSLHAFAAAMGGVQAISAAPHDLPLGMPDLRSGRTALRTLQVLQEETGVGLTADPAGGSDAIERRTGEISLEAFALLDREARWMRAEYRRRVDEDRRRISRGERVIVGVNQYVTGEAESRRTPPPPAARVPSALTNAMETSLAKVEAFARQGNNVMPALVSAAEAGATMASMLGALKRGRLKQLS